MDKDEKRRIQKNMTKEQLDIVNSMTKGDWNRIKEEQEVKNIKKGSYAYNVAVANDQLRVMNRNCIENIQTHVFNINNFHVAKMKKKLQIDTGIITDKLN